MQEMVLKDSEFQKFSRYVGERCGINLHDGKKELLRARLGKILRNRREFRSFRQYYDYVVNDESGHELKTLLDAISTNLTYFFREEKHFEAIKARVVPELTEANAGSRYPVLRFWSAGCSSGEEPYSLAITLSEALNGTKQWQTEILATDLSTQVLATASNGIYDKAKVEKIPYELRSRYFQKGEKKWEGHFRVKKEIRDKVTFQRLNLMDDLCFNHPFHLIFCRNVMIYFDNPTKEALVAKFHQNLRDGGYLFIGHSETLTGLKHSFKHVQPSVFRKV